MSMECDNGGQQIDAMLGRVEQSVNTLAELAIRIIPDMGLKNFFSPINYVTALFHSVFLPLP